MFSSKTLVLAAVGVASASAFQAPAAFNGMGARTQAACRSSGVTMSMEETTSRRGALGALLAGALAIPAAASASSRTNSAYAAPKGYDREYQLRAGGEMTDVESSSMSGVRASGAGVAGIDAKKKAAKFSRAVTEDDINKISSLTDKMIAKDTFKGIKTSNKIGINPAFGGSSGIFTGAK